MNLNFYILSRHVRKTLKFLVPLCIDFGHGRKFETLSSIYWIKHVFGLVLNYIDILLVFTVVLIIPNLMQICFSFSATLFCQESG